MTVASAAALPCSARLRTNCRMRDVSCQCFIDASRTGLASHDASCEAIEGTLAKNIAISTPLAPPMRVPRTGVGDETHGDLFTDAGHRRPRPRFRAHGAGRRFFAEVVRPAGIDCAGDP